MKALILLLLISVYMPASTTTQPANEIAKLKVQIKTLQAEIANLKEQLRKLKITVQDNKHYVFWFKKYFKQKMKQHNRAKSTANQHSQTPQKHPSLSTPKLSKIEGNWYVKTPITIKSSLSGGELIGEIYNNSNIKYESALFKISLYDDSNNLVEVADLPIINILPHSSKAFHAYTDSSPSKFSRYKIQLDYAFPAH